MIDGKTLRDAIISGANSIANHYSEVDELNVFPVPDGDTGTNMNMTMSAARDDLLRLPDRCAVDEVAKTASAAMLRGARGNSGVITSLLFRGFSKALAGKKRAETDDIVKAFEMGVTAAYKAVMKPTEGTILTVARVVYETLSEGGFSDMNEVWTLIVDTAQEALEKTPDQLPILKKAGVVDAGGKGFCIILEGMKSVITEGKMVEAESGEGRKAPKPPPAAPGKGVFSGELNPDITNGYCTEFLVNKNDEADPVKLRSLLETRGDSVVVVDDDDIIKCHIHTENPGDVLTQALLFGYLSGIKIENMHEQYEARQTEASEHEKSTRAQEEAATGDHFPYAAVNDGQPFGFVAVSAGEGLHEVFNDLGVDAIVEGGQTMNPSTEDILEAVHSVPAKTVFVLPNNKNIIMAAEQVGRLADRKVVVLPTRSIPQGMSAMLAYDPDADEEANTIAMRGAAEQVSTGLVTFAARDSSFDGRNIKEGDVLGLENGRLAFVGNDVGKITSRLARDMCDKNSNFLTLIAGEDVSEEDANETLETLQQRVPPQVEATMIRGGQPVYYYMISVE